MGRKTDPASAANSFFGAVHEDQEAEELPPAKVLTYESITTCSMVNMLPACGCCQRMYQIREMPLGGARISCGRIFLSNVPSTRKGRSPRPGAARTPRPHHGPAAAGMTAFEHSHSSTAVWRRRPGKTGHRR